jgi:hypothetical protein
MILEVITNLYRSPSIAKMIRPARLLKAWIYSSDEGTRWKVKIKMDLWEVGCEDVICIEVALNSFMSLAVLSVFNLNGSSQSVRLLVANTVR